MPTLLLPLIEAAAMNDSDVVAAAERAAEAKRQQRMHRLETQLSERNAEGARGLLRACAVLDGNDTECAIGGSEPCSAPCALLCCRKPICECCLGAWLRPHGEMCETGYGTGVHTAEHTRSGRPVKVPMDTHRCPFCQARINSVRRALCTVGVAQE